MAEGKLHIKGTITIKSGKEESKKEKEKKNRKKKGKKIYDPGFIKQRKSKFKPPKSSSSSSFESQPYTPQALMTALALRPQITYQQPDLQQVQQMQQRSLEAPMYTFEDIPQLPYDAPIQTTKREIMAKAEPLLRKQIQEGIQQERELYQEEVYTTEQEKQRLRQQLEDMRQDVERQTQFFENEMERAQVNFQKQTADLEQRATEERQRMALERIQDKAKLFTDSVFDKAMFNVVSKTQQKEIEKSQKELERLSREKEQVIKESELEVLQSKLTAPLRAEIKRLDPNYVYQKEPDVDEAVTLREQIAMRRGLDYGDYFRTARKQGRPRLKAEEKPLSMEQKMLEEERKQLEEKEKRLAGTSRILERFKEKQGREFQPVIPQQAEEMRPQTIDNPLLRGQKF